MSRDSKRTEVMPRLAERSPAPSSADDEILSVMAELSALPDATSPGLRAVCEPLGSSQGIERLRLPFDPAPPAELEPAGDGFDVLEPGAAVGDYVIEERLGEGGVGVVYRARHRTGGEPVAIKCLKPTFASSDEMIRRFEREVHTVREIAHPSVVEVLELGRIDSGVHYYVMELLVGRPLGRVLRQLARPCTLGELAFLLSPIVAALAAVHARGITHRDIKPDNVFVVERDGRPVQVKLLDFGLARLHPSTQSRALTQTGIAMGTPSYMSPEQCLGKAVDQRGDIYALGIIAYEMLTGRLPFEGEGPVQVMMRHVQDAPVPPSQLVAMAPHVERAILSALAKRPSARPADVQSWWRAVLGAR